MFFQWLKVYFRSLYPKDLSIDEVIELYFPESDREIARRFYKTWEAEKEFWVERGDGFYDLEVSQFYTNTRLVFESPWEIGDQLYLARESEADDGIVAMDVRTGTIVYLFGNEPVMELAETFTELLRRLEITPK